MSTKGLGQIASRNRAVPAPAVLVTTNTNAWRCNNRMRSRWCLITAAAMVACSPAPAEKAEDRPSTIDVEGQRAPRPGIHFDPGTLRVGQSVGAVAVDSIDVRVAAVDSAWVGTVRFRGAIELTGWTLPHPDPDLRRESTCFEADSASAGRLPRWIGDERRAWFCFANRTEAAGALGSPIDSVPATIVIDDFTIHRGYSDQVNSARFVRLVRQGQADRFSALQGLQVLDQVRSLLRTQ